MDGHETNYSTEFVESAAAWHTVDKSSYLLHIDEYKKDLLRFDWAAARETFHKSRYFDYTFFARSQRVTDKNCFRIRFKDTRRKMFLKIILIDSLESESAWQIKIQYKITLWSNFIILPAFSNSLPVHHLVTLFTSGMNRQDFFCQKTSLILLSPHSVAKLQWV